MGNSECGTQSHFQSNNGININTSQPLPFEIKRWHENLDFSTDQFSLTQEELLSTPQEISFGSWTHHVPNTIPANPCKSQSSHTGPDLGFKERMNLPCQVTCTCLQKSVWSPWMILWPLCRITLLFLLCCKNMGQFEQIPEKGGREFLRAVGRGWYTDLCHCRSCGFAAGCHLWRSPCASFPRLWISHGVGLWLEFVP